MTVFTSLEPLKDYTEIDKLIRLANYVIKYQKFKTRVAVANMKGIDLKDSTKGMYFERGVKYLNTGVITKGSEELCRYIAEGVSKHIQPLTPTYSERRKEIKARAKKNVTEPVLTTTSNVEVPTSKTLTKLKAINKALTSDLKYGVLVGSNIVLNNSESDARAFLKGIQYMGDNTGELVSIKISKLES